MADEILSKIMSKYTLAKALCNSEEYEEALSLFDKAIKDDPSNYAIHESKGDTYFKLERYLKAISEYKTALGLNPNRGYLRYLIKRARSKLLSDINDLILRKNYNKALELSLPLIKHFPNNVSVLSTTSEIYFYMKEYMVSIKILKEILQITTNDEDIKYAMINMAYSMCNLGMYEDCIKLSIKSKEKYDNIQIDLLVGDCYKLLHDKPNSEKYYDLTVKKILKMSDKEIKKNSEFIVHLIKENIKHKNYSRQILLSKLYINKVSKNPHAMIDLAEAYKEIGKYREAIRVFEKTADYYSNEDAGQYAKEQIEMCRRIKGGIK